MARLFDSPTIRDLQFANRVFRLAYVRVLEHGWIRQRLAFRPSGQPSSGRRWTGAYRGNRSSSEGRISPQDLGIWSDEHIEPLARIVSFIHEQGSGSRMQLAHAGRKASTYRHGKVKETIPENEGGWKNVMAPSALPFAITILCRKRSPLMAFRK